MLTCCFVQTKGSVVGVIGSQKHSQQGLAILETAVYDTSLLGRPTSVPFGPCHCKPRDVPCPLSVGLSSHKGKDPGGAWEAALLPWPLSWLNGAQSFADQREKQVSMHHAATQKDKKLRCTTCWGYKQRSDAFGISLICPNVCTQSLSASFPGLFVACL